MQHFTQGCARRLVRADFERAGGAESDGRQRFTARRNAPHEHLVRRRLARLRLARRIGCARAGGRRDRRQTAEREEIPSIHWHGCSWNQINAASVLTTASLP